MITIDVVGGVYWERCAFPVWDFLFGSAGRAACALSSIGQSVKLHTSLSQRETEHAQIVFGGQGVELKVMSERNKNISFEYLHPLSNPKISGVSTATTEFDLIESEVALVFGMMEGIPRVKAKRCVYDPQSPRNPLSFKSTGSVADRLAIVANSQEIRRLANNQSLDDAAQSVLKSEKAEVVVVKNGIYGAKVYTSGQMFTVSAYKAHSVFTIGSGDIFVSAFSYAWAILQKPPDEAAEYASRSTATYVESRDARLSEYDSVLSEKKSDLVPRSRKVYLAGPFREVGQRMLLNDVRLQLTRLGQSVFSPVHDIGRGDFEVVVPKDLEAIKECDSVFAIMNGLSPGTIFEIGYAAALGKPIYCLAENVRSGDLKLPKGVGAFVGTDYVTTLFEIATAQ